MPIDKRSRGWRVRQQGWLWMPILVMAVGCGANSSAPTQTGNKTPTGTLSLFVTPATSYVYPATTIGQFGTETFTLQNNGTEAVNFAAGLSFAAGSSGEFSFTSNSCSASLASSGSSCSFTVKFSPTAAENVMAVISIANNASGSPQSISLSASGVVAPSVTGVGLQCTLNTINAGNATMQPIATTCTASVKGTGAFDPSVTWAQPLGATLSVLSSTQAIYTSYGPFNFFATATSVEDPTQSNQQLVTVNIPSGTIYWGADGHRDKGENYSDVATGIGQQIADLQKVFGTANYNIFYRAWDDVTGFGSDITSLQSAKIIPVVGLITFPDYDPPCADTGTYKPNWMTFTADTAAVHGTAYIWAYCTAKAALQAAPTVQYWVVGNEWNNQGPMMSQCVMPTCPHGGYVASDWRANPYYPVYLAAMAGAVQALRDKAPAAKIIAGANGGRYSVGFSMALAQDLESMYGLAWDYTNLHWYNDAYNNGQPGDYEPWGLPDVPSQYDGNSSEYLWLDPVKQTGQPEQQVFVDEFGSSNGANQSNPNQSNAFDANAGADAMGLMGNFLKHAPTLASEQGVAGATYYELYPSGVTTGDYDKFLFTYSSSTGTQMSPQGSAVMTWIQANHNPSIH